jgi:hypothetical protein
MRWRSHARAASEPQYRQRGEQRLNHHPPKDAGRHWGGLFAHGAGKTAFEIRAVNHQMLFSQHLMVIHESHNNPTSQAQ